MLGQVMGKLAAGLGAGTLGAILVQRHADDDSGDSLALPHFLQPVRRFMEAYSPAHHARGAGNTAARVGQCHADLL